MQESLFKLIVEQSPEPIIIHNVERILYANRKALEYLGEYASDLRPIDLVHPDYRTLALERIERVLAGEKVEPAEELFLLPDGREIWVETSPSLIEFEEKPAILLILRDLTHRKRIETALRESEEKYRKIFENAPVAIVVWDEEMRVFDWNSSAEKVFGWKKEEIVGRNFFEFLIPNSAMAVVREVARKMLEGTEVTYSVNENLTKDGGVILCEWLNTIYYEKGRKFVLSIAQDITQRMRILKILRQLVEANEAIVRIKEEESLKKKIEEILQDYRARILEKPEDIAFEVSYGGKRYGYLCVKNVGEEEKKMLKALAEDLAYAFWAMEEEKRKDELLMRLRENVELISTLVDRIRNPLAVIRAYAEMLIEDKSLREKIETQVERIVRIMDELDTCWIKSERLFEGLDA